MAKLEPGVEIQYRRFDHPDEPATRLGKVKVWGRKWVEITTADGKVEWSTPENCSSTDPSVLQVPSQQGEELLTQLFTPQKLSAGTQVCYRRFDHPYEAVRVGLVKEWGRKWVQVTTINEGKVEWSTPSNCSLNINPNPLPSLSLGTRQTQSVLQQPAEEFSVFTYLAPGCLVEYHWSDCKGVIGGAHIGYFTKYEKTYHQVSIRTIPAHSSQPSTITLKEHLVTPVDGQPAIDLGTGQRVVAVAQEVVETL